MTSQHGDGWWVYALAFLREKRLLCLYQTLQIDRNEVRKTSTYVKEEKIKANDITSAEKSKGRESRRSHSSVKGSEKAAGTMNVVVVCFGHWEICLHCRIYARQIRETHVRDGSTLMSLLKK